MRKSKVLLPFLMLFMVFGLYSFTASDSVRKDSTFVKPESFKVQNLKQSPETTKSYEVIQKLEFQKSIIQERIDSVFNLIDSLANVQPDTTRHHKGRNVLPNKVGSIESLRELQKEPNKRGHNFTEKQSNYFATITAAGTADNLQATTKPDNHQKEHLAESSNKRGHSFDNCNGLVFC